MTQTYKELKMNLKETDNYVIKFNEFCIEEEIHDCFKKLLSSKSKNKFELFEKRISKKTAKYVRRQTVHMSQVIFTLYGHTYTKLRAEYVNHFSEDELSKIPRFQFQIGGQYAYVLD